MTQRCTARMTAVIAALVALAGGVSTVRAAGIITYQLVNTSDAGTAAVTEAVASIIPPGSVAATSADQSPLSILPGSSGFDVNNLKVSLGDGSSPTGDPLQAVALDFGNGGFAPGGVLNFSLTLADSYTGAAPQLILPPGTSGLKLNAYTPPPTSSTGGPGGGSTSGTPSGGATQVPEPISIVLWSAVAGAGLVRARVFRRARRAV